MQAIARYRLVEPATAETARSAELGILLVTPAVSSPTATQEI
jgi:ABC-type enterochelin transport system permease subunit